MTADVKLISRSQTKFNMNTALVEFEVNPNFWVEKLKYDILKKPMNWDREGGEQQNFIVGELTFESGISAGIRQLGKNNPKAMNVILLSSLFVLAKKYDRSAEAFSMGIPVEKSDKEFSNVVPMILAIPDNSTFQTLLNLVREEWVQTLGHQNVPVKAGESSLFDWVFGMDLDLDGYSSPGPSASLLINAVFQEDELLINWKLDIEHISEALLNSMFAQWQYLLSQVLADISKPIQEVSIISVEESRKILGQFDGKAVDNGAETIVSLFRKQAQTNPGNTALIFGDTSLTFAELDDRSNQLAQLILQEPSHQQGSPIALFFEPSTDVVVSMLSAMKAGSPYVPISPEDPKERVNHILKDSSSELVLTTAIYATNFGNQSVMLLDELNDSSKPLDLPVVIPEDPIYVIYTSGTTGMPKGVKVLHKGVVNYSTWRIENYGLSVTDITMQVFPYHFDGYGCNLYSTLLSGATLLLMPDIKKSGPGEMLAAIKHHKVTNACVTSGVFDLILSEIEDSQDLHQLRFIALAGDKPTTSLIERSNKTLSGLQLTNEYGLTETSIGGTCNNQLWAHSPGVIGKPNFNTQIRILDKTGQLQAMGVPGELFFCGSSVADSYLNREDLNQNKFIEDPFMEGNRAYATGDMARWLPDGQIEFLGRQDEQIKIRGYRVELGEIENNLKSIDGVTDATIQANSYESVGDEVSLCGYFTGKENLNLEKVHELLAQRLPEYMVPTDLLQIDQIPLTATGKVDIKALPVPEVGKEDGGDQPITSPVEKRLAELWSNVIEVSVDKIFRNSNFFDLGGHSIKVLKIISQIQKEYGVSIDLQEFFQHPTITAMAEKIDVDEPETIEIPELIVDEVHRFEPFPLSDVQYAYWIGRKEAFSFGNIGAHGYFEFYAEELDIPLFKVTLKKLIDRHEVLRMVVTEMGEQQVLKEVPDYHVDVLDLSQYSDEEGQKLFFERREAMSHHVFSGEEWPLFDLKVTIFNDETYKVHYSTDGLVMDAESLTKFVWEFNQLYQNPQVVPGRVNISFRDYMISEKSFRNGPLYLKSKEYWQKRVPELPLAPELPVSSITMEDEKPKFIRRSGILEKSDWDYLQDKASKLGVTPTVLVISCFSTILNHWSRTSQFILNLTLYNRIPFHEDVDHLLGDFTSLTLLEVDFRENTGFSEQLKMVQERMWRDLEHKYYGGIEVLRSMSQHHGNSIMMPVVLTSTLGIGSDDDVAEAPNIAGNRMKEEYAISQTPQVWIDFQIAENKKGLWYDWDCVDKVFPAGMLDDMFAAFSDMLHLLTEKEMDWDSSYQISLPAKQQLMRESINATNGPEPVQVLHQMAMEQVKLRKAATAIQSDRQALSYEQVGHMTNVLAHQLVKIEAKPNTLVAIVMHKGWEQIIATLGILESGSAYLPIDASFPEERINLLLEQGGAEIVLTVPEVAENNSFALVRKTLLIDVSLLDQIDPGPTGIVPDPSDLAYVIFTSGSTGLPKGVVIDHRGASNTICDMNERFGITHNDKVLALSSLSFDLSVFDIFGILGAGGTVVIPEPSELRDASAWYKYLQQDKITLWNTVPAFVQILVEFIEGNGGDLSTLRNIWMSGDWIPVNLPDRIKQLNSNVSVTSLGGATEASIWSIYYYIGEVQTDWKSIPYGKPLKNQEFFVLDKQLNVCPDYVTGDLYIGGIGLAKGYWKDEEKTNNSFITHPDWGTRIYKTGDTGRYLPDGNIEFQGRVDSQVKIQGYRIELGEVETAINGHSEVKESTVIVRGERGNINEMIAYVVPKSDIVLGGQIDHKGVITDPEVTISHEHERSLFKLEKNGLLRKAIQEKVRLPHDPGPIRLSRRARLGEIEPGNISIEELGEFLVPLRAKTSDNVTLSKYFYPSAGSLYPVQTYLEIPSEGMEGIVSGVYYLHPEAFELQRIGETNSDKIQLHLVADLDAIKPLYGALSSDFVHLEAGYMAQLLMNATSRIAGILQVPEKRQTPPSTILVKPTMESVSSFELKRTAIADKSDTFDLDYNERKSYRSFEADVKLETSEITALGEILSESHLLLNDPKLKTYLSVESGRVAGFEPGLYNLDLVNKSWEHLNSESANALFEGNEHLTQSAGLAIFLAGPNTEHFNAGFLSQALMNVSIANQIGWCAVGVVEQGLSTKYLELATDEHVLHSLIGGKVSTEQIEIPNSLEVVSPQDSPEKILRDYLSERLPRYMVPTYYVGMEKIPLTTNGKVDRKSLPAPTITKEAFVAPKTEVEIKLAEIWAELLELKFDDVDLSRTFFEMGGHSLKATLMVNRIFKELNVEVPLREIFEEDTIPNIANFIENQLWVKQSDSESVQEGEEFILD